METKNLLFLGGIGAAVLFLYSNLKKKCAQDSTGEGICQYFNAIVGPGVPSIPVDVISNVDQATFIKIGRAQGMTDAAIQAKFNEFAARKAACHTPNVWDSKSGDCWDPNNNGVPTSAPSNPAPISTPVITAQPVMLPKDQWFNYLGKQGIDLQNQRYNMHQWNWHFNHFRGSDLTGDEFGHVIDQTAQHNADVSMSAEEYWNALHAAGFAGLAGMGYGDFGSAVPDWYVHGMGAFA